MADVQIVKTDQGAVNARILAKEAKADFRRVEAASIKMRTHFTSAEAKRLFVRMFHTLQLNAHFISVIARTRIEHQDIEKIEAALRADIDATKDKLNQALDGAEALFKAHGIGTSATYDTQPLEIEVGILSSSGRRYLEALNQFDQLMPLLQTLEIHEVITTQALDIQRAALKRQLKDIANGARRLATGLRRRMNTMAARDAQHGAEASADGSGVASGPTGSAGHAANVAQATDAAGAAQAASFVSAPHVADAGGEGAAVPVRRVARRHVAMAGPSSASGVSPDNVPDSSNGGDPGLARDVAPDASQQPAVHRPSDMAAPAVTDRAGDGDGAADGGDGSLSVDPQVPVPGEAAA